MRVREPCPRQVILCLPPHPWRRNRNTGPMKKTQQNSEKSELTALGAPFPAMLGVPSYLYLTVFFLQHEDKGSGTDFAVPRGGTEEPGRVTPCGAAHRRPRSLPRGPRLNGLPVCLLPRLQRQGNRKTLRVNTSMQGVVSETVIPAKCKEKKKKTLKGNNSCQTTSCQIPSRWNLYFEAMLCPKESRYRARGTDLGGSRKVCMAPACLLRIRAEAPFNGCTKSFLDRVNGNTMISMKRGVGEGTDGLNAFGGNLVSPKMKQG